MLAAFALENYACFRDRHELSFHATPRSSDIHAFDTGCPQAPRLNRVTAIYGPNGSGKSRLVQALMSVRQLVLGSARDRQDGEDLPHTPFLFDRDTRTKPSVFETSFIEARTYYEYRFSNDRKRILEEALFGWPPGGRRRLLLNRRWNPESNNYDCVFGHSVSGTKELWRQNTRSNALLVSVAAQLNSAPFTPIVRWFQRLRGIAPSFFPGAFTTKAIKDDPERRARVLEMLQRADIAVSDLAIRRDTQSLEVMKDSLPARFLPARFLDELTRSGQQSIETLRTQFGHKIKGTEDRQYLDLKEESDGTQRLFALAGPWLEALEENWVVWADELDRSLHPLLLESLIRRINTSDGDGDEPSQAQLVATLHDTYLLDDALGRGQIWFTEKNREEAVSLFPLSDYRPRKHEALERGYRVGRYGGIPVVSTPRIVTAH